MAIFTPQQATRGASTRLVVSPTPPVECLSAFIPVIPLKSSMSPDLAISMVSVTVSRSLMPFMAIAMSIALI